MYTASRFVTALLLVFALAFSASTQQPRAIHISMARSFFIDRADVIGTIVADDFKTLLKSTTGLDGDLATTFNAFEIADRLDKKQADFGIFHAYELAWVQSKHADLQPLLVAVNKTHPERVFVVVHKDSPAKSLADLRGKKLDLPSGSSDLCRVYVAKRCRDAAQTAPADFFGSITKTSGPVAAIDEVAREKAQATAVTTAWLEFYKEVKGPTFTNQLRVLEQSDEFPPTVLVHKRGALDPKMLDQFKSGLLKADKTANGREMMKEWNVDAFEVPAKDYAERVTRLLKSYPTPESKQQ